MVAHVLIYISTIPIGYSFLFTTVYLSPSQSLRVLESEEECHSSIKCHLTIFGFIVQPSLSALVLLHGKIRHEVVFSCAPLLFIKVNTENESLLLSCFGGSFIYQTNCILTWQLNLLEHFFKKLVFLSIFARAIDPQCSLLLFLDEMLKLEFL